MTIHFNTGPQSDVKSTEIDSQVSATSTVNRRAFIRATIAGSVTATALGCNGSGAAPSPSLTVPSTLPETSRHCFFMLKLVEKRNVAKFFKENFQEQLGEAIIEYKSWQQNINRKFPPKWTQADIAAFKNYETCALTGVERIYNALDPKPPNGQGQTLRQLFAINTGRHSNPRQGWARAWPATGATLRTACGDLRTLLLLPFYDVPNSQYNNKPGEYRDRCSHHLNDTRMVDADEVVNGRRTGRRVSTKVKSFLDEFGGATFRDLFFTSMKNYPFEKFYEIQKAKTLGILRLHAKASKIRSTCKAAAPALIIEFNNGNLNRQNFDNMMADQLEENEIEKDEFVSDYLDDFWSGLNSGNSCYLTILAEPELAKGKCAQNTVTVWSCISADDEFQCGLDSNGDPLSGSDFC